MTYQPVQPVYSNRTGTIDTSLFTRTGSPYTNPEFFRLYLAQTDQQSFDTLFGEEGLNNSIFGDSSVFEVSPSSSSPLFGGSGQATMPTDIAGATSRTGGSQYFELIARTNLIGKTVEALDPTTKKTISGKVISVIMENGLLLINVESSDGKTVKVPPEYLTKISS